MTPEKLKVAYLSPRDPRSKLSWSGTMFYMNESMMQNVGEVYVLGPYDPPVITFILKVYRKILKFLFRKNFNFAYSSLLTFSAARFFDRQIKSCNPDVIVAVSSTPFTSKLRTSLPIIIIDDINFSQLLNYYDNYSNLPDRSIKIGHELTSKAYKKSAAVVFSSEWSKKSTIDVYDIPEEKIHVISFGANLDKIADRSEALHKKISGEVKLLFIGVDWYRKGGYIAFEALKDLNSQNIPVTLTVCGCVPPDKFRHDKMKIIPFLNKNNPEDFTQLFKIYLETHFLIIPTRADCTPIVFCEANSFGVPVVTTDTGGVSAVIEDGINGILHQVDDDGFKYAETIKYYYNNPKAYNELVQNSRNTFENRLNWISWGHSIKKLSEKILSNKR